LPIQNLDGTWTPGEWVTAEGPLVVCENGIHLCREGDLLDWVQTRLFEIEGDGVELIEADHKVVVRRARLVREIITWNERTARLFACDCAEVVLPLWEAWTPDDARPRETIGVARRFAHGEATVKELAAARTAARTAARDAGRVATGAAAWTTAWDAAWAAAGAARAATWDAAGAAAWAAAGAAARATRAATGAAWAAWAAAGDAARDAARAEQLRMLLKYLRGEEASRCSTSS
jgi:hypothetical protein